MDAGTVSADIYFSLEGTARIWFENHEASLTSWDACVTELRRSFKNQHRRQREEDRLQTRTQVPNESVTSFVEDVLHLRARADPQATEKKLLVLMKGVKSDIFGGLVRNLPTTIDGFVVEATSIERALSAWASHFHRLADIAQTSSTACSRINHENLGIDNLREFIRDAIRDGLKKLLPTTDQPASLSIAEIVGDEVQKAFEPGVPIDAAAAEEPTLSCAAVARPPPPVTR